MGDLFVELFFGIFRVFYLLLKLFGYFGVLFGIGSVHLYFIAHHLKLTLFHFLALLHPFDF